jgi:hypothetical protein
MLFYSRRSMVTHVCYCIDVDIWADGLTLHHTRRSMCVAAEAMDTPIPEVEFMETALNNTLYTRQWVPKVGRRVAQTVQASSCKVPGSK